GSRRPGTAPRAGRGSCPSSGRWWWLQPCGLGSWRVWGLDGGILGRQRQRAAALGGDHDRVLDADAAVLGKVDAGLDGDDVAVGQATSSAGRDPRRLVDGEADPVARAVE